MINESALIFIQTPTIVGVIDMMFVFDAKYHIFYSLALSQYFLNFGILRILLPISLNNTSRQLSND
jgi:hypothetical protein